MWEEVSFVLSQFTRLTDGRTDRDIFIMANAALHSMQRGKNGIQSYIDGLGVYNSCRPISSRKVQSSVAYVRFTTVNHHYFV